MAVALVLVGLGVGLYRLDNRARILTAIALLAMFVIGTVVTRDLGPEQVPLVIIPVILLTGRMRAWFAFARGDLDREGLRDVIGEHGVPEFTDLPDWPS